MNQYQKQMIIYQKIKDKNSSTKEENHCWMSFCIGRCIRHMNKQNQKEQRSKNRTMFRCKHDWHKKNIDIQKKVNLKKKLFKKCQNFRWLFKFKKTNKLWKLLYNMFHNELLILQKILNDYLNKKFIKINNSSAASFVLFAWKPDEELWFCVNYHALNKFTRKNHYLSLLIHKTLNNISKIKWFMKLNIITVFQKFRIIENDKWLTIFHTKYELFEELIIFFWFDECIE